jgi:hypothetical protein
MIDVNNQGTQSSSDADDNQEDNPFITPSSSSKTSSWSSSGRWLMKILWKGVTKSLSGVWDIVWKKDKSPNGLNQQQDQSKKSKMEFRWILRVWDPPKWSLGLFR